MSKMLGQLLLVSACLLSGAQGTLSTAQAQEGTPAQGTAAAAPAPNPVVDWNRALLALVRTPGAQPATVHPTRSFAMMHAAIYDAVNAIDGGHAPYAVRLRDVPRHASEEAAAAAAAHDVLVALYPALAASLDAQLAESLSVIPETPGKAEGIDVGRQVATRILALRSNDGSAATPVPYEFGDRPGDYQSTPNNFPPQPVFTHWRHVDTFVLHGFDRWLLRLRLQGPPRLSGRKYARALDEVQSVGGATGNTSSPDEALTGRFWSAPVQNYWNEIAQTVTLARKLDTADAARLFALLNLSIADSFIVLYDAKYAYNFWRPVTAVRAADTDDNEHTVGDPEWLPAVGNSPPDPSYPGAHAVVSATASVVLRAFFRDDHVEFQVTSEALPDVVRSFDRFSAAMREASLSRIFAGVHYRFDEDDGEQLGADVARIAIARLFRGRHDHGPDRE